VSPDAPLVAADGRYLIVREAMGQAFVAGLLDYTARRSAEFQPATVYRSQLKQGVVDSGARACLRLGDLGEFRAPFQAMVEETARHTRAALGVHDSTLKAAEFEICAYSDGDSFRLHADTTRAEWGARVLTVVYYFSTTPRPFAGGQLRIHPWPVAIPAASREPVDVEPECDTLLIFPSILPHEVLPVHTSSPDWSSRRFNLTCWMWRPAAR
jgi:SM-20-related protein